jgi:hypothetical protein
MRVDWRREGPLRRLTLCAGLLGLLIGLAWVGDVVILHAGPGVQAAGRLARAPKLVILGGSRGQRFAPSTVAHLTGLTAFNFAMHNCRTYDACAISKYLFARSPGTKLRCVFALQATTLVDTPMDQALLYDRRFSQWFPAALLRRQKAAAGTPVRRHLPSADVYSARGCIVANGYDRRLTAGVTLAASLDNYLASMVPRAASTSRPGASRCAGP